jgi:type IV secretory pathway TraG/TraD family ATPase VirD4
MNSGKSIIISLGGLEDETKRLIGAMLMVAIEQAALSRTDIAERRPFTLLVDEWGSFAAQERTIATILSQCRKFALRLYLAAQSLSQVSSSRLSGALENCKLMIAFALGRASAEIQAKQLGAADPFAIKEEPHAETQHSQI